MVGIIRSTPLGGWDIILTIRGLVGVILITGLIRLISVERRHAQDLHTLSEEGRIDHMLFVVLTARDLVVLHPSREEVAQMVNLNRLRHPSAQMFVVAAVL